MSFLGGLFAGVGAIFGMSSRRKQAKANAAAERRAAEQARLAARQSRLATFAKIRQIQQNEFLTRREAEAQIRASIHEEDKLRDLVKRTVATQRAIHGASGLAVDVGTPVEVERSSMLEGRDDVKTLRENYARRRFALVNQAQLLDAQAHYTAITGAAQEDVYKARAGDHVAAASVHNSNASNATIGGLLDVAGIVANNWNSFG